jgi:hypothetical protein
MTPLLTEQELAAHYSYVVSEEAIQHVVRLSGEAREMEARTSVVLMQWVPRIRRSILELRGLGKEVWEGIDPKRYIDELRDEWDAR